MHRAVHVAGRRIQHAQRFQAAGGHADFFLQFAIGGLLGRFALVYQAFGQRQLVALGADGVFADHHQAAFVQRQHHHRRPARGGQPLVGALGAVGKTQINRLHLENAGLGGGAYRQDFGFAAFAVESRHTMSSLRWQAA